MTITHIADHYLDACQKGTAIEGGLAFQKALGQVNLDFSPESLARIDQLLEQIRDRLKPQFDAFIGQQENQNFLYMIAFYAGEVVARRMGWQRQWLQHPELLKVVGPHADEYPYCFATSISCLFENGACFLPLSSIQERLFEAGSSRSLQQSAARYMQSNEPVKMERSSEIPAMLPGPAAAEVKMLAGFAGMSAAFAVFQVAEGATMIPTLAHELAPGQRRMDVLMRDSFDEAIAVGQQRIARNTEGALRTTFAVDGYINLPGVRTDALLFEARSYVAHGFEFAFKIPYRNASAPGGFAIYSPRLVGCTCDAAHIPLLQANFFAGFDKFNPQGLWKKYFDPSV